MWREWAKFKCHVESSCHRVCKSLNQEAYTMPCILDRLESLVEATMGRTGCITQFRRSTNFFPAESFSNSVADLNRRAFRTGSNLATMFKSFRQRQRSHRANVHVFSF